MSRAAVLASVLAACACAARQGPALVPGGGVQHLPGFSVELPPGWLRTSGSAELVGTRDGFSLQTIQAWCSKPSTAGLLPVERAEVTAAFWRWSLPQASVTAMKPATLAGMPGFRVEVSYRDLDGLACRRVDVGATVGDRLCVVSYVAPARHYFELDLPAFERAVASFSSR